MTLATGSIFDSGGDIDLSGTDLSSVGHLGIGVAADAIFGLRIDQDADNAGIRIFGFDDRSAENAQLYIDENGATTMVASSAFNFLSFAGDIQFTSADDVLINLPTSSPTSRLFTVRSGTAQKFTINGAGDAFISSRLRIGDTTIPSTATLEVAGTTSFEDDTRLTNAKFHIFDKASGNGIKVDTTTPTFGFADLLGEVFARNTGANKPTRATWKGGTRGFQFGVDDEEEFEFHIPHDYVKGSDIFLHIHWGHNVATVTGGTVTFDYDATYAKGHNQGVFGANAVGTVVSGTVTSSQYSHDLSEGQFSISGASGTQIDTDDLEPDGVIKITLGVSANDITVSGGGVPEPFIHYVDIHYQTNGIIGTKSKVPDFYA